MNEIIRPGAGILFMKIGTHANEGLDEIIQRKSREIKDAGYAMWGYGGNTCHPSSMVQPFAQAFKEQGKPIHLVMEPMNSKHFAEPLAAAEYSTNNVDWSVIPSAINVLGSRYALVIQDLKRVDFLLPLDQTRVPVGPSNGKVGSKYISGRVDKACLEVLAEPARLNDQEPIQKRIGLVAELRPPYAVFLRNYR
ncbi:hypothetical protein [Rhodopseudomonas palustris]|uniref:Uncharacterized protein n=1 Tax=Rhodopseudomonas palustris TaxID=1076 RepID=A0A418VE27_RHOPL|nr:hypothetical protein [Rhodopseudomonas palustris]RJF74343.1 hypothetical protein D4Q52_12670 [Rhodopseudomonas palustris]